MVKTRPPVTLLCSRLFFYKNKTGLSTTISNLRRPG